MGTATLILLLIVWGVGFFFAGARWGMLVIESFKGPCERRRVVGGQRWHIPGIGKIVIVQVWDECVSYFTTKDGRSQIYIMNREEFNEVARDDSGRDPTGNFHKSIRSRVLPFEIREGGRK